MSGHATRVASPEAWAGQSLMRGAHCVRLWRPPAGAQGVSARTSHERKQLALALDHRRSPSAERDSPCCAASVVDRMPRCSLRVDPLLEQRVVGVCERVLLSKLTQINQRP